MLPGGILQRRSRSGDGSEEEDDLAELARCIEKADMPPHVHKVLDSVTCRNFGNACLW
jgi:hypothetical protein